MRRIGGQFWWGFGRCWCTTLYWTWRSGGKSWPPWQLSLSLHGRSGWNVYDPDGSEDRTKNWCCPPSKELLTAGIFLFSASVYNVKPAHTWVEDSRRLSKSCQVCKAYLSSHARWEPALVCSQGDATATVNVPQPLQYQHQDNGICIVHVYLLGIAGRVTKHIQGIITQHDMGEDVEMKWTYQSFQLHYTVTVWLPMLVSLPYSQTV